MEAKILKLLLKIAGASLLAAFLMETVCLASRILFSPEAHLFRILLKALIST